MVVHHHPSKLTSFFIFDPSLGGKEGQEHEKIMLYYPPHVDPGERHNKVGLAETLIRFTATFSPAQPCEAVHQRLHRQVMIEPERDLWMVMTVTVPFVSKKEKNGTVVDELHPEWLDDESLRGHLTHLHRTFVLFNGTMTRLRNDFSLKTLRDRLDSHFPSVLQPLTEPLFEFRKALSGGNSRGKGSSSSGSIHGSIGSPGGSSSGSSGSSGSSSGSLVSASENYLYQMPPGSNVFSLLRGLHFLPVDKDTYLLVQCFVNLTENAFPRIKSTTVMYDRCVVWSGLPQAELRTIYAYVVEKMRMSGASIGSQNQGSALHQEPASSSDGKGFVLGPERLHDDESPINAPQVFVGVENTVKMKEAAASFADPSSSGAIQENDAASSSGGTSSDDDFEQQYNEYRLVVYKHARVTVIFLVDPAVANDVPFYRSLSQSVDPAVFNLASVIEVKSARAAAAGIGDNYRFLYFNRMNLAIKTSLKAGSARTAKNPNAATVTPEAMAVLLDIRGELTKGGTGADPHQSGYSNGNRRHGASSSKKNKKKSDKNKKKKKNGNGNDTHDSNDGNSDNADDDDEEEDAYHFRTSDDGEEVRQVMVRTAQEGWIVGQRSHEREFYVLFDNRSAELPEIEEELKRLSATYFNNIFID